MPLRDWIHGVPCARTRTRLTRQATYKPTFICVRTCVHRWPQHQVTCGGEYIKIREPEGYKDKRKRRKTTATSTVSSAVGTASTNKTVATKQERRLKDDDHDDEADVGTTTTTTTTVIVLDDSD